MPVVSVKGLSKKYRIFRNGRDRLKDALSFGGDRYGHDFWVLRDVDLEVEKGTTLGILGRNGAGKSTLLNIIAGILQPTSGTVEVNGRLVALSGLGAGFNSEFTGRENVMLNGLILGMERHEMLKRFDDIAAFADIGEHIDQPLKTYSSGMRSRLGFAVAVNVEPDVLILDETLAVGDAVYKEVALQKMYELRDSGTTILFVSHSMNTVQKFCTEAVLLHEGRIVAAGETADVTARYEALLSNVKERKDRRKTGDEASSRDAASLAMEGDEPDLERLTSSADGKGAVKILSVELLDAQLSPAERVAPNSTVTVRTHLEYLQAAKGGELVVTLRDKKLGLELFSASTSQEAIPLKETEKGERTIVDFTFKVPMQRGRYTVTAVARVGSEDPYPDRVDEAFVFRVRRSEDQLAENPDPPPPGILRVPVEIKVHAPEREWQGRSA